jgi:hypothetical protein
VGTPQRQFPYGIDDPTLPPSTASAVRRGHSNKHQEAQQQTPQAGKRAAAQQQRLTDAMFGTGPRELSTRTATGLVVKANSDGCLAAAQRDLYGDQARWFRTEVAVNNLEAMEAGNIDSMPWVERNDRTAPGTATRAKGRRPGLPRRGPQEVRLVRAS